MATATSFVVKSTTGNTTTTPANQVAYEFYDIVDAQDLVGKKIKTRRLRERTTLEQLAARKGNYATEMTRIDGMVADIKALP